jgi:hypothetical protein
MDSAQSQGTEASQASAPLRDLAAHFVRYLELRLQLFGLESRETGLHLLVLDLVPKTRTTSCSILVTFSIVQGVSHTSLVFVILRHFGVFQSHNDSLRSRSQSGINGAPYGLPPIYSVCSLDLRCSLREE